MASDTKLLGTLELDIQSVLSNIQKVNTELSTLGKNINLDLTNAVNTAVQRLQQEIQNLNNLHFGNNGTGNTGNTGNSGGSGNGGNPGNGSSQLRQTQQLLQDQYRYEARYWSSTGANAQAYYSGLNHATQQQVNVLRQTNAQLVQQAENTRSVTQARQQAEGAAAKAQDRQNKADAANLSAQAKAWGEYDRAFEAAQNQWDLNLAMQAKAWDEYDRQQQAAFDKAQDQWDETIDQQSKAWEAYDKKEEAAFEDTQNEWQQNAIDNYQQQLSLKAQILGLDEKDVAQKAELSKQLSALEADYQKYGKDVQAVAESSEQAQKAQVAYNNAVAIAKDRQMKQQQATFEQWANRGIMFAGRASINLIGSTISNASHFAQQLDNYLNQIQIVTLKSDQQMSAVDTMIKRVSQTLGVTSLDVASGATLFYRMGFSDAEVEERLMWVSKFAKVANVDFADAAKMIVTITNSMSNSVQRDIQRVSDVLLYLGDNSATTAGEVATAMQSLGPVADAVGISFERIASMTAALSDKTQQSATRIATGLRTVIMRLYAVRNSQIKVFEGIADDGEMEELWQIVNDPSKLMKQMGDLGIKLQDETGNWRDFYDIMYDVAQLWKELGTNDPKRSAIMNIFGGMRGAPYISALLDSIAADDSKVKSLYSGAVEAYGTTNEKYDIWMDSAAAAQERYNAALQEMYSVLNVEVVKAWYGAMALVAHYTALSTKSFVGFNLIIPAIIAGFVGITAAVHATGAATLTFGTILNVLKASMQSHPILWAATIFVTLATTISIASGVIIDAIENTRKAQIQQYNDAIDMANKAQQKVQTFTELKNEMNAMFNSSSNVTGELEKYNSTLEALAKISPTAAFVVQQLKDGLIDQKEAARLLNEELDKTINRQLKISAVEYQAALEKKVVSDSVKGLVNPTDLNALTYRGSDYVDYLNQFGADNWANTLQLLYKDYSQWRKAPMINQRRYTSPIADQLAQWVAGYLARHPNADWDTIEGQVWGLVKSDNFEGDQYQQTLQQEMESWLNDAIGASGISHLPQIVQDILIERLKDIIVGEDGVLDKSDFADEKQLRAQLSQAAVDFYTQTFNKNSLSDILETGVITPEDVVFQIYDRVYGNRGTEETNAIAAMDELFQKQIIDAYSTLSSLGFSDSDIAQSKLFGIPDLYDEIFGALDDQQIKSAQVLIQQFGWTIADFYNTLSDPNTANTFTEFLKNTNNELTTLTSNTSFDDLKTVYSMLAYVSNKTQNGEDLNVSDLTYLSRYAPWLLNQVGTETFLPNARQSMENISILMDGYFTELAKQAYASLDKRPSGISKTDWIKATTWEMKIAELTRLEDQAAKMSEPTKIDTLSESSVLDEHMTYMPAENVQATNDALEEAQAQIDGVQAKLDAAAESAGNLDTEYNKLQADLKKTPEVNEGLDATYESFEKVYSELKNYERGSAEYWARLNELMQGGTEEIIDATDAFVELNKTVDDGNKSGAVLRPDLSIGKGLLAAASMADVGYGGTPKVEEEQLPARFANADAKGLQAYIEAALSLTQYAIQMNTVIEESKKTADGYFTEVNALAEAFAQGGIYQALITWQSMDDAIKKSVANTYPSLIKAMGDVSFAYEDEEKAAKALEKELDSAKFKASARYFSNTAKSIDKLKTNTISAADAYAAFYKESEKAITAQSEYLTATDKLADGSKIAASDVENLASYLGFVTPDALIENWDQVGSFLSGAIDEGTEALNRLNEAAFIQITGTSVADFSALTSGLISVKNLAEDAVRALIETGQWKLETINLPQQGAEWDPISGKFNTVWMDTKQSVLRYTGKGFGSAKSSYNKNSAGSSSSGGGGGGGGSSKKMTEVERMLDRMAQIQTIQNHVKSLYAAQASMFKETGQLQMVIKYYEKEREAIEEQNKTLRANIAEMEPWLEKKKAEVAALKVTDAQYEEASSDLEKLQKRHQEYSLAIINNTAEIDKLTDSIKEQRDAIRKMEIDLRNTILEAIKDREALNKRMLEGTIKVENTIIDLIKKRYEKERDMIIENTEKQIDALQKERDLLSEQLDLRKKQAEEEDKAAKLAELEAKYARISADPTRRKEALSIQQEINDLRDEIAWDTAEKEVQAQQDSIDQQVNSLEDYKEYINNYYEYLFEHPQQLIEEMQGIIQGTNEEIIAWLEANDEEYAKATDATKEQTINSWNEMLRDMRGELELFWDEVEEIIAGGDDFIVNFLIENSAKYREAGKLQAEAYVDEWLKQLDDLRKAYELVTGVEPDDYVYIAPAEGNSSGGGGGGGGPDGTPIPDEVKGLLSSTEKMKAGALSTLASTIDSTSKLSVLRQLRDSTTVTVPSVPNIGDNISNNGSSMTVGDIIVNVDTLSGDSDYEEVGEKVFNGIVDRLNRGSVVGGIRFAK